MNELKQIFELDSEINYSYKEVMFKDQGLEMHYINFHKAKLNILRILSFIVIFSIYIYSIICSYIIDDKIFSSSIFYCLRRYATICSFILDLASSFLIFKNKNASSMTTRITFFVIFKKTFLISIIMYMFLLENYHAFKNRNNFPKHIYFLCSLNRIFYLLINRNNSYFFFVISSLNFSYLFSVAIIFKDQFVIFDIVADFLSESINLLITFFIKRKIEIIERKIFSEKYLLQNFFQYFQNMLKTLNCLHFSFSGKKLIYSNFNKKLCDNNENYINKPQNQTFRTILKDGYMINLDKNKNIDVEFKEDSQLSQDKQKIYENFLHDKNIEYRIIKNRKSTSDINLKFVNLNKSIEKIKLINNLTNTNFIDKSTNSNKHEKDESQIFLEQLMKKLKKIDSIQRDSDEKYIYEEKQYENLFEFNKNILEEKYNERKRIIIDNHEEILKNNNLNQDYSQNLEMTFMAFKGKEKSSKSEWNKLELLNKDKILNHLHNISYTFDKLKEKNEINSNKFIEFIYLGEFISVQEDDPDNINKYNFNKTKEFNYYDVYYRKFLTITDYLIIDKTEKKQADKISLENSIKQNIFAKLAHEFKTPLNSIISLIGNIKNHLKLENDIYHDGISDNKKDDFEEKGITKDLNIITGLSNYTLYLISDIIQYSSNRKDKKRIKMSTQEVKLKKILSFNYEILNALIACNEQKENMIKTSLEIDELSLNTAIKTDEFRLNQIILNLISNAVKFTKLGQIKIKAELSFFPEENNTYSIILSIEDTGMGIKDVQKNFIFKETHELDINYEENKMGSGLGLSICYELVKRLDYKISFKSEIGKGTIFYIEIPQKSIIGEKTQIGKRLNLTEENFKYISKRIEQDFLVNSKEMKENKNNRSLDSEKTKIYKNDFTLPSNLYEYSKFYSKKNDGIKKRYASMKKENINIINNINLINISSNLTYRENEKFIRNLSKEIQRNSIVENSSPHNNTSSQISLSYKRISEFPNFDKNSKKKLVDDFKIDDKIHHNPNQEVIINKDSVLPENILKLPSFRAIPTNRSNNNSSFFTEKTIKQSSNNLTKKKYIIDNKNILNITKGNSFQMENEKFQDNEELKIIIIIDDNKFLRNTTKICLQKILFENKLSEKFIIIEGRDGIDLLKHVIDINYLQKIKMIITDQNMEYMQGSTAIKIIRDMERMNKLPTHLIFTATSHDDYFSEKEIISAGADKILGKPFTKERLLQEMKEFKIIT